MILSRISLENFRQFKGKQSFSLDVNDDKTVSLLFGANGSGKTTLLNAFTWCLYGDVSEDVEEKHRLATDIVWQNAVEDSEIPVSVEIEFLHGDSRYRARREGSVRKRLGHEQQIQANFALWRTWAGQTESLDGPQEKMNSILPKRLSRFFFFNGERIERLAKDEAYAEVKEDIKILLRLEQVERALKHLPTLKTRLGGDLRKHGGEEVGALQDEIDENARLRDQNREALEASGTELQVLEREIGDIRRLLEEHAAVGPLQGQLHAAKENREKAIKAKEDHVQLRKVLVGSRGHIGLCGKLAEKTAILAEALHQRGALPAPIKREFVDSLVAEARCICGTDLAPGTAALASVEEWRARAGLAEVEASWQRLSGDMKAIKDARQDLRSHLQEITAEIEKDLRSVSYWDGEVADLTEKTRDVPYEDVVGLQSKEKELDNRLFDVRLRIKGLQEEQENLFKQQQELDTKLKKAQVAAGVASTTKERIEIVDACDGALRQILDLRSTEMRRRLDEKVKNVFSRITIKPFYPELTDDFKLGLYHVGADGKARPVAKGTGENQVLSLSFVAAISELAREVAREETLDSSLDAQGHFPIVMDAAFGSLDRNYRRDISRALVELAPQMVVLVSTSQGQGEVYSELQPYLNHLGIILAHTTAGTDKSQKLEIGGHELAYIDAKSDIDWSELLEVEL